MILWLHALSVFLLVYMLSVFLHELGHVLAARAAGLRANAFGLGHAKPLWSMRWGSLIFFIARQSFLGGLTLVHAPYLSPPRWRMTTMMAGGMIANILLTGLAFLFWWGFGWGTLFWQALFWCNLFLCLLSLIPMEIQGNRAIPLNDGANIRAALHGRTISVMQPIVQYNAIRPLVQDIGDTWSMTDHALNASACYLLLGDTERSQEVWEGVQAYVPAMSVSTQFRNLLVEASRLVTQKQYATWEELLHKLDTMAFSIPEPLAPISVQLLRVTYYIETKQQEEAKRWLKILEESLQQHPEVNLQSSLQMMRVSYDMQHEDIQGVLAKEQDFLASREGESIEGQELLFVFHLARWFHQHDQIEATRRTYRTALQTFQTILLDCEPTYKERLLQLHADFVEEATAFLQQDGEDDVVTAFHHAVEHTEAFQQQRKESATVQDRRRYHRWARTLYMLNFMAGIGIGLVQLQTQGWLGTMAFLWVGSALGLFTDMVLWLGLYPFPRLRGRGGYVSFLAAIFFTVMWVTFVIQHGPIRPGLG